MRRFVLLVALVTLALAGVSGAPAPARAAGAPPPESRTRVCSRGHS